MTQFCAPLRLKSLLLVVTLASCSPASLPAAQPPPQIEITAYDSQGVECPRDALPQWPAFELNDVPYDPELPLYVIAGELDADLIDDLAAAPLRQSNLARSVPFLGTNTPLGTLIWPTAPLNKGQRYTIALLPSAATRSILPSKEPFAIEVQVSTSPSAGAAIIGSLPVDQQSTVDPNLTSLRLAFDGRINDCAALRLHQAQETNGVTAAAKPLNCNTFDDQASFCCVMQLEHRLTPNTRYVIAIDAMTDFHGAPVIGTPIAFETAANSDDQAPLLLPQPCDVDEQEVDEGACMLADENSLSLRLLIDQPSAINARIGDATQHSVAARGQATLRFSDLPRDQRQELRLVLESASGARRTLNLQASTTPPLATLAITEVLADPRGPEPAQEYVEIWNFGPESIALDGLQLSDDGSLVGQIITSSRSLPSGGYALLVTDDYDPEQGLDPAPAPGVPLVRVGKSLAKSGLANRGEPLFLRDASGHRLSSSPDTQAPAGTCLTRIPDAPPRLGTNAEFTIAPCSPGQ